MTIFCIGYYDKSSRFFLKIKESLRKNVQTTFRVYSLHFSGFLYTLMRLEFSSWLPLRAWVLVLKNKKKYLEVIQNRDVYKDIGYRDLITYHTKLNSSIPVNRLLFQALAYIDIFENIFINDLPDLVLLYGDSRLSSKVCISLAKKYKIKIYFIEQGPFNTTFFSDSGVNANVQVYPLINGKKSTLIKNEARSFINTPANKKYLRSFVYRGIDLVLTKTLQKSIIFPPDLIDTDTFYHFFKSSKQRLPVLIHEEASVFLLILQIPLDVNMICHSPFFDNHFDIVKAVHQNLPGNSQLIIREHPFYQGKYEKKLYEYAETHNLSFDHNTSLKDSLELAKVIIVNNSTVGIEAISFKKTVVVLGNAYYDNPKICLKLDEKTNLGHILERSLHFSPQQEDVDAFLYHLMANHLIKGHIKDKNIVVPKMIAKKIEGFNLNSF